MRLAVTSSRLAKAPRSMWDLANTPLFGREPHSLETRCGALLAVAPEPVTVSRGAAVDANVLRGHPARRVAGQKGDDRRYLGRLTESAECAHRLQAGQELLALAGPVGLSFGGARA